MLHVIQLDELHFSIPIELQPSHHQFLSLVLFIAHGFSPWIRTHCWWKWSIPRCRCHRGIPRHRGWFDCDGWSCTGWRGLVLLNGRCCHGRWMCCWTTGCLQLMDPCRLDSLQPDELICPCLKSMSGLSLSHPWSGLVSHWPIDANM